MRSQIRGRALGVLIVTAGLATGVALLSVISIAAESTQTEVQRQLQLGENPFPIQLQRPRTTPLSAVAQIGKQLFFDPSPSASGSLSCSSCHSPDHFYGPIGAAPAVFGGPNMSAQGARAVPSLMYLERQPGFSVGPDKDDNEDTTLAQMVAQGQETPRATKTADNAAQAAANLVPQGGLFWDGRADTLQDQAIGPMLNPLEMANASVEDVARRLLATTYIERLAQVFGSSVLSDPRRLVSEAMFAVGRFQIEDKSFHPYSSKFDAWLEGKARLNPGEMRGYVLFNDPNKANCGGCHVDLASGDGTPPVFTDGQFEALGAPRNIELKVNEDPRYFDLGICGPLRADMKEQTQYCGMFVTPTLRNVASRSVFFHNGVFHTLQEVVDFYNFRDIAPQKIYRHTLRGRVVKYDDLPPQYQTNIDTQDPPFNRKLGDEPAMTPQEEADIIAFLKTLTDGYTPTP